MLVINSNSRQEGFTISNSQIWVYPDLNNYLFLMPDLLFDQPKDTDPSTATAIETIWGTNINRYPGRFIMPEYLIWTASGSTQPLGVFSINGDTNSHTSSMRIWTEFDFSGWEVIGESIIWGNVVGILAGTVNVSYVHIYTIKFTVQLLHSDWTLTQIAQKVYTYTDLSWLSDLGSVGRTTPSYQDVHFGRITSITPTKTAQTWVTALAWDRLVLDIEYSGRVSNSSVIWTGLFFGYKYTSDDALRCVPTQVSIR